MESILTWIEYIALAIEALAVVIIVAGIAMATLVYLSQSVRRGSPEASYDNYRVLLGRALLLGLEILVAADIIRTVALEPSLTNVSILGLLVVIRTFLSWSLVVEIEHRWPWQAERTDRNVDP